MSPPGLGDLARRAKGDDSDAREQLMTVVYERAFRYARGRLGQFSQSASFVEDIAQEVCIAVLQSLPRYDDRGAPFEAFVYSICANKVADVQRKAFRLPTPVDEMPESVDHAPGPEDLAVRNSEVARAQAAMACLSDKERELIMLRVVVGLSSEETARSLGMSPGAVRVAQHRALGKLRDRMTPKEAARR